MFENKVCLNGLAIGLGSFDQEENTVKLVKKLTDRLTRRGVSVFDASERSSFRKLRKVMKMQFLLSFKEKKDDSGQSKIRIFYSLRKRQESLKTISLFIKGLLKAPSTFAWELPGFFDFLFNLKYMSIYASSLPAVLIEMINFKPEEQEVLQELIYKGLIGDYVRTSGEEQAELSKNKRELSPEKDAPVYLEETLLPKRVTSKAKKKKQTRKSNPLLLPPEGPTFQFSASTKGEIGYPLLPPLDKDEKVNVHRSSFCVKEENKEEVNLLAEIKKMELF